jgi:hypothetical protein
VRREGEQEGRGVAEQAAGALFGPNPGRDLEPFHEPGRELP